MVLLEAITWSVADAELAAVEERRYKA